MGSFIDDMSSLLSELIGKQLQKGQKNDASSLSDILESDGVPDLLLELAEKHSRKELKKEETKFSDILERAEIFAIKGDTKAFKQWIEKADEMAVTDAEKADVLVLMAEYGSSYAVASSCYEKAAGLVKGSDPSKTGRFLYKAGTKAYYAEDYLRAIGLLERSLPLLRSGRNSRSDYLMALHVLSNNYYAINKVDVALLYLTAVSELYREDGKLADYHKARCQIASYYQSQCRYREAITLYEEALGFFEKKQMKLDIYTTTSSLSICRNRAGCSRDYSRKQESVDKELTQKTLKAELDSLEQTKRYFGSDMLAQSLNIISDCLLSLDRREEALLYADQFVDALRDAVIRRFRSSGPAERETFWEAQKLYLKRICRFIDRSAPTSGTVAAMLYDIALLEKAILLNSSIEFQKILHATGDDALEASYRQLIRNEERIRESPDPDLVLETERINTRLMDRCRDYKDYTQYLSCTWHDVQGGLGGSEAAVEFFTSSDSLLEEDDTLFAIVLRRADRWPVIIPLCSVGQLETMVGGPVQESFPAGAYSIIAPILPYLDGVRSVWFSPDRNLCHYGIEYCEGPKGTSLADMYETHRVSSTREVCRRKTLTGQQLLEDTVLLGGASYEGTEYPSLPNARLEVIDIDTLLRERGFRAGKLTGRRVTKEALLSLSGGGHSIIHIAAHGDYHPKEDGMSGSVLILSDGETVTAKEISSMNLRRCRLVTLSACNSSIGKLGDDGVFGLQRGFKNAGAGAILMTAGEVDDAISYELMKSFYSSLAGGKSLHDAYEMARNAVKDNHYGAVNETARFILLEA